MAYTTDQFELLLLSAMVKDVTILNKVIGFADESFFSSTLSAEVFDIIKVFSKQYERVPSHTELLHIYKRDRTVSDDTIINSFLNTLYGQEIDPKFVTDELNRYIKLRRLEVLHKGIYEKLKSGTDVDISANVSDMFRIHMDSLNDKHIYGVGINETDFIMEQALTRNAVPTNLSTLNEVLEGGLAGGQLGIILAPPNYGKTMSLLNFALYAYTKGKNVLFVTLEMPEFAIMRRVMHLLAGALKMESVTLPFVKQIVEKTGKEFRILYRPVKTITVDYLYSVYHQAVADNIKFDVIFIDYADLLTATVKHKERRFELADVFSSLKAFAQVINVPVWSATQANREGLRAEVVKMEHMSESIDKAFVSDVVLSLCDKMKPGVVTKFFLTKHREGKSDVNIDMYVNDKMWIEDESKSTTVSLDNVSI